MSNRRRTAFLLGGALGATALAGALMRGAFYLPRAVVEIEPVCKADAPVLPTGRPIKVLAWNLQYAGSRSYQFFYDGGPTVSVPAEVVARTLDEIAFQIRRFDPDLILLQEVDRYSRRTAFIDELEVLAERLDMPCLVSAPYHRAAYVPHPDHEHLGRIDMHLGVLSRWRLGRATRYQLPLLEESRLRQLFNLRRALLEVQVPRSSGPPLVVFDTHLSAFSWGDGTLGKQVEVVRERLEATEAAGIPWLLAGDLNALPPGDDPARFGVVEATRHGHGETPIQPLFSFGHPVPQAEYDRHPERWWTYQPFGEAPDRTLDYLFHGSRVRAATYTVVQDADGPSDHLPLVAEFLVGG